MAAQGASCQRAWAYMRDANGGNGLTNLPRYDTALLREYDRSRQELEKLQKIRAAKPTPPPVADELRREPDPPITPVKSTQPAPGSPAPSTPKSSILRGEYTRTRHPAVPPVRIPIFSAAWNCLVVVVLVKFGLQALHPPREGDMLMPIWLFRFHQRGNTQ